MTFVKVTLVSWLGVQVPDTVRADPNNFFYEDLGQLGQDEPASG